MRTGENRFCARKRALCGIVWIFSQPIDTINEIDRKFSVAIHFSLVFDVLFNSNRIEINLNDKTFFEQAFQSATYFPSDDEKLYTNCDFSMAHSNGNYFHLIPTRSLYSRAKNYTLRAREINSFFVVVGIH